MNKIDLSIIIPVYNEKKTLLKILDRIKKANIQNIKEIIIVDDFSKDGTRDIIKNLKDKNVKKVFHTRNYGKGHAIRTGLQIASGGYIIIQDADQEYDPKEINKLVDAAIKYKFKAVYGSRMLNKENHYSYLSFYLGNVVINVVANLLYFSKITDLETCYKLIQRELIMELNLKAEKFDFEPEVTAKLLRKGIKIKEIPISYNPRSKEEGKKIKWKDGVDAILTLLKYRFFR